MSDNSLDSSAQAQTAGMQLAQARVDAGISEREVSDALNLPITTVRAIEADDQEQLPAAVFSRGYVRAYAKLLELDPEKLMAAIPADKNDDPEEQTLGQGEMSAMGKIYRALLQPAIVGGVLGVLVLIMLVVWWLSPGETELEGVVTNNAEQIAGVSIPVDTNNQDVPDQLTLAQAEAIDEVDDSETQTTDITAAADQLSNDSSSGETAGEITPVELNQADTETTTLRAERRLTPTGNDALSLEFSEECWLEIKSTDGTVLFADIGRAGERMSFIGAAPFRVLLGYAPGAQLRFNDGPVALSPHTRNNVASLVLGQ